MPAVPIVIPATVTIPVPSVLVTVVILPVPPVLVTPVTSVTPPGRAPFLVDNSVGGMPRWRGFVGPLIVPRTWVIVIQRLVDQVAYDCAGQHLTQVPAGVRGPGGVGRTGQRNGYDKSDTSETDGT